MSNVISFIPVSNPNAPATTSSKSTGKRQFQRLLDHFNDRVVFGQLERQAAPNLETGSEDERKMDKLQEELETLKLYGAGIAHDLSNVLTVVAGNLELARLSYPKSELWQTFVEIEEAVEMAKALNKQLRQLFQGPNSVKESITLGRLLEEATRLGVFGSEVKCSLKLAPELPVVQGDRYQLSQVIVNLVLNSVQAMPGGGQIEIEATPRELAEGQVQSLKAGKYIEIRVSDNGRGIFPEHLSMIFAPYFTTKAHGQGLGLALCYTIIKRHQGHINVESEVGVGTTFRVWLPLH